MRRARGLPPAASLRETSAHHHPSDHGHGLQVDQHARPEQQAQAIDLIEHLVEDTGYPQGRADDTALAAVDLLNRLAATTARTSARPCSGSLNRRQPRCDRTRAAVVASRRPWHGHEPIRRRNPMRGRLARTCPPLDDVRTTAPANGEIQQFSRMNVNRILSLTKRVRPRRRHRQRGPSPNVHPGCAGSSSRGYRTGSWAVWLPPAARTGPTTET